MANDDAQDTTPDAAAPEEPAATPDPAPRPPRTPVDRRSLGLGALAVGALVLAFVLGMAIGGPDHHDRFERAREASGPMMRQGGGMRGERAMPGMRGGGHGRGGAGVVEAVSADKLTVAPLHGPVAELTVQLDDDTEVKVRGADGAQDIEDAAVSDIDEGDIVMVMGSRDESDENDNSDDEADDEDDAQTLDADVIVILRDADA